MEKRQEREQDSSKKEHTTKLITPQVAKVEHSYRPGRPQRRAAAVFAELQGPVGIHCVSVHSSVRRLPGEADRLQRQQPAQDDRRRGDASHRRRGPSGCCPLFLFRTSTCSKVKVLDTRGPDRNQAVYLKTCGIENVSLICVNGDAFLWVLIWNRD